MPYTIRYEIKKGGSGMQTVSANSEAMKILKQLFKNRQAARIEKNNIIIGESYKSDGQWNWYMDTEA